MSAPVQKITFAEMRAAGVHRVLIYCTDYRSSHSTCLDADPWADDIRLSDIEPMFVCAARGRRGADIRPDWRSLEPRPRRQPKTCNFLPNTRTPVPPIDPDLADLAPSHPALTPYDEQHAITYMRLLDADAEGPTGARSRGSCCASIRTASSIERGRPSRAILPAPDGRPGRDTGTCFDMAGRAESRKKAYEFEIR